MDRDEGRAGRGESGREDLRDEDGLSVQRSEEELQAGTREREAGQVGVRKSVRTEREQIAVPKKREEVDVDRVPVDDGTPGQIGEDEASMSVVEEEVVVDKQAVVKEEIRVKKDVVQDEEVVEGDVRKEEIDIEDPTERRAEGQTTSRTDRPERPAEAEGTQEEGFMDKAKKKLKGQ